MYYTFLIIFKKPLILLNNYKECITQKKKKKFKKEKKELSLKKKFKKKKFKKKGKKILSLKYNTTVTTLTVTKAYRVRGDATIQFTHFRSF